MLIIFSLHCIVHVTFRLEEVPTPMQVRRGYEGSTIRQKKLKVKNLVSTQVPPEKGWFCMLIIFGLLCIVHVTSEEIGLRPCLEG